MKFWDYAQASKKFSQKNYSPKKARGAQWIAAQRLGFWEISPPPIKKRFSCSLSTD
jgi:hypothetical protein